MSWLYGGGYYGRNFDYNDGYTFVDALSLSDAPDCDVYAIVLDDGVLKKKLFTDCGAGLGCDEVAACISGNAGVQSALVTYINGADFTYTGTLDFTGATVNGLAGGGFDCDDVANCVTGNAGVQSALNTYVNGANFTLTGSWDFTNATVSGLAGGSFDCGDVANCINTNATVKANIVSLIEVSDITYTGNLDYSGATVTGLGWGGNFFATRLQIDASDNIGTAGTVTFNIPHGFGAIPEMIRLTVVGATDSANLHGIGHLDRNGWQTSGTYINGSGSYYTAIDYDGGEYETDSGTSFIGFMPYNNGSSIRFYVENTTATNIVLEVDTLSAVTFQDELALLIEAWS